MKTLAIMFTKPDRGTQPGGLILRERSDGFLVTHRFNRVPHTRSPVDYFWGHYFNPDNPGYRERAQADFDERASRLREWEISEAELIAKGDVSLQPEFD